MKHTYNNKDYLEILAGGQSRRVLDAVVLVVAKVSTWMGGGMDSNIRKARTH